MMISPLDAWRLHRSVARQPLNGELDLMSEPWRGMAAHMASLPPEEHMVAWQAMLAALPELTEALKPFDPLGPPPENAEPGRSFATLADVAKIVSSQPWLWKWWIALGVLNAVAAEPGVGKTRFALDVARRLWLGLPWPDGQPNKTPPGTRTLWVQGDRNWSEMLQAARDFGLPDEAVALGSSPEEPFGSLDLDDRDTLAALGDRIQAAAAPLVVVDTVGMTTSRNLSRPDEAREFFAPLLELAQQTGVAFLGLTHLSMNKEALGRRIVEKARSVIKMTQPDPEGQPDRRRLWVDKTAVMRPPPLGITMGTAGNDYDFNPPKEPDAPRPGPAPVKREACKSWLTDRLTPNPARVTDVIKDGETAKFSRDTLYQAMRSLGVEEYTLDRRKWWKLPSVGDVANPDSGNSDNSDKPY